MKAAGVLQSSALIVREEMRLDEAEHLGTTRDGIWTDNKEALERRRLAVMSTHLRGWWPGFQLTSLYLYIVHSSQGTDQQK